MIPKGSQKDPKMIPKLLQNDPKTISKGSQNYQKRSPQWSQNDTNMIRILYKSDNPITTSHWFREEHHILDSSFPSLFFIWCCYVILLCDEWILLCDIVILLCDMFIWYYYMILYSSLNQCDVVMGWSFLYNIRIIFVSFWDHCGFLFG